MVGKISLQPSVLHVEQRKPFEESPIILEYATLSDLIKSNMAHHIMNSNFGTFQPCKAETMRRCTSSVIDLSAKLWD